MPSKYGSPTLVMIPPANGAFSTSSTFAPALAAASAAAVPAQPAPHTSTSVSMVREDFADVASMPCEGWIALAAAAAAEAWMKRRRVCGIFGFMETGQYLSCDASPFEMRAEESSHDGKTLGVVEFLPAMHAARQGHKLHRTPGFPIRGVQFTRLFDGHLRICIAVDEQ